MGGGQSKIFKGNKQSQYGPGMPTPYPYQGPQQPFIPPGFPQRTFAAPVYPAPQQGFIPPGYGQHPTNAQMLNWLPQDKQRKRRRTTRRERYSEDLGVNPAQESARPNRSRSEYRPRRASEPPAPMSMPQPVTMPQPTINAMPQPVTMPQPQIPQYTTNDSGPTRRPTPFIPGYADDGSSSDSDDDREPTPSRHSRSQSRQSRRSSSQRPPVTYPQPAVQATLANVIQPIEPPEASAYGPRDGRSRPTLKNPLPPPPRDLYEMSPYKQLLSLPQTTALLTATYNGAQQYPGPTMPVGAPAPKPESKNPVKGLLRRLSTKKEKKRISEPPPQVRFVPVFVDKPSDPVSGTQASTSQQPPPMQQHPQQPPPAPVPFGHNFTDGPPRDQMRTPNSYLDSAYDPPGRMRSNGPIHMEASPTTSHSSDFIQPVPPMPTSPPEIRFDQDSPYYVFMNHSPHRVMYRNQTYPTALHLHEALKFLDHRPDIATAIRNTVDIHDVYPIAAKYQEFQRPDWNQRFLEVMEDVLYHKFKQHPDLRIKLLETATARLIYTDTDDDFWGVGSGGGQNQLGKALVRVRERLRREPPS